MSSDAVYVPVTKVLVLGPRPGFFSLSPEITNNLIDMKNDDKQKKHMHVKKYSTFISKLKVIKLHKIP